MRDEFIFLPIASNDNFCFAKHNNVNEGLFFYPTNNEHFIL